jgi:hypothetical protein
MWIQWATNMWSWLHWKYLTTYCSGNEPKLEFVLTKLHVFGGTIHPVSIIYVHCNVAELYRLDATSLNDFVYPEKDASHILRFYF